MNRIERRERIPGSTPLAAPRAVMANLRALRLPLLLAAAAACATPGQSSSPPDAGPERTTPSNRVSAGPPPPAVNSRQAAPGLVDTPSPAATAPAAPAHAPQAPVAPAPPPPAAVDPGTLPQTRDLPRARGPRWDALVAGLWSAIVRDEPERAMPFFFPRSAYGQVKNIRNPPRDWQHRLVAAYQRDLHMLHARLRGRGAEARLVGLEVPPRARWMEPGTEGNKLGYHRVLRSKLRYELDGRAHSFPVLSLISWRGQWYAVHLNGFK